MEKLYFIWEIDYWKDEAKMLMFFHSQEQAEEYIKDYDGPYSVFWEKKELNRV